MPFDFGFNHPVPCGCLLRRQNRRWNWEVSRRGSPASSTSHSVDWSAGDFDLHWFSGFHVLESRPPMAESVRQPCNQCPFNPDSPTYKHGHNWAAALKAAGYMQAHGCHKLEDKCFPKPENVCVGHQRYLEQSDGLVETSSERESKTVCC